ncbi:MAG TPA: methyl-accepting chemotaxis protein [Firmicutes bacterium]|nr:methyl-accepting chemotaxis protein [Bacillota bacterium]
MSFLDDLPVWGKLYLIIGVFVIGMVLMTTVAGLNLNDMGTTLTTIHDNDNIVVILLELKQALQQARQTQITALVPQYQPQIGELYARFEQNMTRLKNGLNEFLTIPAINHDETELRSTFRFAITEYDQKMTTVWGLIGQPNKIDELFALLTETRNLANTAEQALTSLLTLRQEHNNRLYNDAIGEKNAGVQLLIFLAACSVGIGFLISHYIVHNMATRLRHLATATEELATGHLGGEDGVVSGKDEIGHVAHAFEVMRANLRDLVSQVFQVAQEISGSSHQLAASAQETSGAANQSASAAQQFASNSVQMSTSAQSVAVAAKQSLDSSQGAQREMEQAVNLMHRIQDAARRSAHSVDDLATNADRINEITVLIRKIADQTNLLALNAAIEAARAGEHGRGFAVVADEVAKLARQARQSAEEIAALLQSILAQARSASDDSKDAAERLMEGLRTVQKINRLFADVAAASEEATRAIEDISSAAQEIAAGSQQIAVSAQRQSGAIEQISNLSQSLATLGEQLRNVVGWFNL